MPGTGDIQVRPLWAEKQPTFLHSAMPGTGDVQVRPLWAEKLPTLLHSAMPGPGDMQVRPFRAEKQPTFWRSAASGTYEIRDWPFGAGSRPADAGEMQERPIWAVERPAEQRAACCLRLAVMPVLSEMQEWPVRPEGCHPQWVTAGGAEKGGQPSLQCDIIDNVMGRPGKHPRCMG